MLCVPWPNATHVEPFHAIPDAFAPKMELGGDIHVIPESELYCIILDPVAVPTPTTIFGESFANGGVKALSK